MSSDLFDLSQHLKRPMTIEQAHAPAVARGALCTGCALYGTRQGPVLGQIVPNARLVIIGEAPGNQEILQSAPFVGQSGVELDASLRMGGVERAECTVTNTLLCKQPEGVDLDEFIDRQNRAYKKACDEAAEKGLPFPERQLDPFEACRPRLQRDLRESGCTPGSSVGHPPRTLLAVGGKALRAIAQEFGVSYGQKGAGGFATIKYQHGAPVKMADGTIVCSTLHPAFAMRDNKQYTQIIRDHIARAATIARTGVIDWSEPPFLIAPDAATISAVCSRFVQDKVRVTVDIETDSIDIERCVVRCVGLGGKLKRHDGRMQEVILVVPLRWMSGDSYWATRGEMASAEAEIRSVLDACDLVFHNGLFDTTVLLRAGLMSDRKKIWDDSMIGQKDTDSNDLPHDLGFVARQFLSCPLWKKDVDHKFTSIKAGEDQIGTESADRVLWRYNAKDVLCTQRIWGHVEQRIADCGTSAAYELDKQLAPIARDMGRLGVWIDERVRGDLSEKFNTLCEQQRIDFEAAVGHPINPRSWQQVGRWLFEEKGYMPTLNTDGYEFKESNDDDPSTSTPALMALQDRGLDDQTDKAVSILLKFRSCDKLRGSYIDNLPVDYADDSLVYVDSPAATRVLQAVCGIPAVVVNGRETLPARSELSRLFLQWKIHVIPGGRWVCEPTLQNWPSRGFIIDGKPVNMRKMVVAPPGHVLVGADYEQVELRIYGVVANDRYVLKAFKDGLEPHCLNAATIMAKSEAEIDALYQDFVRKHLHGTKDEKSEMKYIRTVAKRVCYLKNYGGEGEKLHQSMAAERDKATNQRVFPGLKKERVDEWEERWDRRHPETKIWHARIARQVREHNYVEASFGDRRKRYFIGGPNKKNAPPNHEIQGAAAGMKNAAILKIVEKIPFGGWSKFSGCCIDIHDFLCVIVPENRAEEAKKIVEEAMYTEMVCQDGWRMPFPAVAQISRNLADQG